MSNPISLAFSSSLLSLACLFVGFIHVALANKYNCPVGYQGKYCDGKPDLESNKSWHIFVNLILKN